MGLQDRLVIALTVLAMLGAVALITIIVLSLMRRRAGRCPSRRGSMVVKG